MLAHALFPGTPSPCPGCVSDTHILAVGSTGAESTFGAHYASAPSDYITQGQIRIPPRGIQHRAS